MSRTRGDAPPALFRILAPLLLFAQPSIAAREEGWDWANATASRTSFSPLQPRETEILSHCGVGDAGLNEVAKHLVARKKEKLPYLDLDGLTFTQRVEGEPHVWPRAWIVSGPTLERGEVLRKMDTWRQSFHDIGERRCGVATGKAADGTEIVAAIALDALADLAPLPTHAHTGMWLTIEAHMLVPSTGAHVVIMGPRGAPRTVPTAFDGTTVRARFAPDSPGVFVVQVVADVATGPRPVLEAQLFADVDPPRGIPNLAAPGEEAAAGVSDAREALLRMVESLRASEQLPTLSPDPRLDAIAAAHVRRMFRARTIGHDLGDGDPAQRFESAGLAAREAGENVAHAQSVQLAHRALYASPSHRANLLHAEFDRMGIAVLSAADGSVWVTEVFASGLR